MYANKCNKADRALDTFWMLPLAYGGQTKNK